MSFSNTKVLIGVLGCMRKEYQLLINEGIKKTWDSKTYEDVEIYYYFGSNQSTTTTDNNIFLNASDDLPAVHKTLLFYEYILQNKNFDYVFRTNCSSYVQVKNLLNFLNDKPRNNFFSAITGIYPLPGEHYGKTFASGSGYFLSRDLVKLLIENKHKVNVDIIDDVAISVTLTSLGINIFPGQRQDFQSIQEINNNIDRNQYHYRCRSNGSRQDSHVTSTDIEIMKAIHKKLYHDNTF